MIQATRRKILISTQAARHDAAACAACLECNEVALCPRKAAVDDALRCVEINQ